MSRKTLLGIIAVLGAVLTVFKEQFGLAIDATAVVGGLTVILLYVLFESKLDFKRVTAQLGKFKDPKFWLALISALLVAVNESFGLSLPIETILAVLGIIMSLLFKADSKKISSA